MSPEKILSVVEIYEERLIRENVPKIRIDPKRTFSSLSTDEILAHVHYLIDGVKQYSTIPNKEGKTGRHLGSIQMCLSFAGWYSLEELMNHNKP